MHRLIVLAGIALAAIGVSIVFAAGGSSAQVPGERTLTFIEGHKGEQFAVVDNPPRSKRRGERASVSVGDQLAFHNPLLTEARQRAGSLDGFCIATERGARFDKATFACTAIVRLSDGTLVLSVRLKFSESDSIGGAISGGSGAYEGARGSFTSTGQRTTRDTFHLLP